MENSGIEKIFIEFKPSFLGGYDIWEPTREFAKNISSEKIEVNISSIDGMYESYPSGIGAAASLGRDYQEIAKEFFLSVGPVTVILHALVVISSGFLKKIGSNIADLMWNFLKKIGKNDDSQSVVLKIKKGEACLLIKFSEIPDDSFKKALIILGTSEQRLFAELAKHGATRGLVTYNKGKWTLVEFE